MIACSPGRSLTCTYGTELGDFCLVVVLASNTVPALKAVWSTLVKNIES